MPACYEDLELADLVVLTGANTAWTHPCCFVACSRRQGRGALSSGWWCWIPAAP